MSGMNKEMMGVNMTTGTVLNMLGEHFNEFEKICISDNYKEKDGEELSPNRHKILTGEAMNIAKKIIANGGTEEEVNKALTYLVVCMDARKYKLDVTKCFDELGIDQLKTKYCYHDEKDRSENRLDKDRKTQLEHAAKKRGVLIMHAEGLSNKEIAENMELPESTVRFFLKNVN